MAWISRSVRRPRVSSVGRLRLLPAGRRLPDRSWRERHDGLTALLWVHVPALYVFGVLRGHPPLEAMAEVAVIVVPATVALVPRLGRVWRSTATSIGLVVAASVLVHLWDGAIEAHFDFFVIIAFLALYQAWPPFLVALGYVIVEHGVVGTLSPESVYAHPAQTMNPWAWAAVHGGFVLAASVANLFSWRIAEQEALWDPLTRLPNRTLLLDAVGAALESVDDGEPGRSVGVLILDLDNFKDANDAFGHHVGDTVIQALALRLRGLLRPEDLLARVGGDEFAVLFRDLPSGPEGHEQVTAVAERVLAMFREPVAVEGLVVACSASVGLAFADQDTTSAEDLLRNADLAMYRAKRDGGAQSTQYDAAMHVEAVRRTELEFELRLALAREEFVVHYQPVWALPGEQLCSTEALVRWQHPTRGLVGPMEFVGAAEQTGLITALGEWVLRAACRQTAAWQTEHPGRALSVAVNLSPRQLADPALVPTVADALRSTGLAASSLCLEITESSLIRDFDSTLPTLNALRALGVGLALDDFGTGFSSLSYLSRLPVDSVKIDRSFVKDLDSENTNAHIVRAVIELAHALKLSVTAEGAETRAQLDTLVTMGSDRVQGYLLSKPLTTEDLGRLLDRLDADRPDAESAVTATFPKPRPAADGAPDGHWVVEPHQDATA